MTEVYVNEINVEFTPSEALQRIVAIRVLRDVLWRRTI